MNADRAILVQKDARRYEPTHAQLEYHAKLNAGKPPQAGALTKFQSDYRINHLPAKEACGELRRRPSSARWLLFHFLELTGLFLDALHNMFCVESDDDPGLAMLPERPGHSVCEAAKHRELA